MRMQWLAALVLATGAALGGGRVAAADPPNVLFIIADDASRHFGGTNGCDWVRTPHIDRLAAQGVVFDNFYVATSKCSPSRAAILTGRNPWQLGEAANHWPRFPSRFIAFTDVDRVPAMWPDDEVVRRDMLDYAAAIEAFDGEVGGLLAALDAAGARENTLVVVTSDNGMPFPRVKGHTFDAAHHLPLVVRWPAGIARPGRREAALVAEIDFAPTFLELFGVDGPAAGMAPLTGASFTDLLRGAAARERPFVVIGRERNDMWARSGTPSGLGYPARGIRTGDWLFVHNFAPDRWPCGDPDLGLQDTDDGPTKRLLVAAGERDPFWQRCFGKRPADELYDLAADPDCVRNLAADPAQAQRLEAMRRTLLEELARQEDPRVLGAGDEFDRYETPRPPRP